MPDQDEIASPWLPTPEYLHDRARAVHDQLLALNEAIDGAVRGGRIATDAPRYRTWKRLLKRWGDWYGDWDFARGLWSSTAATLDQYEREVRDWQAWLRRASPDDASTLPRPPARTVSPLGPSVSGLSGLPAVVWLALGAAGLLLVYRVAR